MIPEPAILGPQEATPRPAPSAWRAIGTAPRDGTVILTYDIRKSPEAAISACWWAVYYRDEEGWMNDQDSEPDPTHWMPLPDPPSDTSDRLLSPRDHNINPNQTDVGDET